MGSIQQDNSALTALAPFATVCKSVALRDWRTYCEDGLYKLIQVYMSSVGWQFRHYDAIVGGGEIDIINRTPTPAEVGGQPNVPDNCSHATATQAPYKKCKISIPNFEWVSIGIDPKHWQDWEREFCAEYPQFSTGFHPMVRSSGGTIELIIDENSERDLTFAQWFAGGLRAAIIQHLARTLLHGVVTNSNEFDGLLTLLEKGVTPLTPCPDFPLKPPVIDWGYLVTGIPNAVAHPSSTIPNTAPPLVLYPGTRLETSLPVAGKNFIQLLYSIKHLLVEQNLEVSTGDWWLTTGRSQDECITRLAGCMQHCTSGCAPVFANPPESAQKLASEYINGRYIQLWPRTEKIYLNDSKSLGARNEYLFAPTFVNTDKGPVFPFSFVAKNMEQSASKIIRDLAPAADDLKVTYGLVQDVLKVQQEYPDVMALIDQFADNAFINRVFFKDAWCFGVSSAAEMTMLMEYPWLLFRIKNVRCEISPVTVCPPEWKRYMTTSCTDIAPVAPYLSTIRATLPPLMPLSVGSLVYWQTGYGSTYVATVLAYNVQTGVTDLGIPEANITCDIGAPALPYVVLPADTADNFVYVKRTIKSCSYVLGTYTIVFDYDTQGVLIPPVLNGLFVSVTSAARSLTLPGVIASTVSGAQQNTSVTVTITGDPGSCEWEPGHDLAGNGYIVIRVPVV